MFHETYKAFMILHPYHILYNMDDTTGKLQSMFIVFQENITPEEIDTILIKTTKLSREKNISTVKGIKHFSYIRDDTTRTSLDERIPPSGVFLIVFDNNTIYNDFIKYVNSALQKRLDLRDEVLCYNSTNLSRNSPICFCWDGDNVSFINSKDTSLHGTNRYISVSSVDTYDSTNRQSYVIETGVSEDLDLPEEDADMWLYIAIAALECVIEKCENYNIVFMAAVCAYTLCLKSKSIDLQDNPTQIVSSFEGVIADFLTYGFYLQNVREKDIHGEQGYLWAEVRRLSKEYKVER